MMILYRPNENIPIEPIAITSEDGPPFGMLRLYWIGLKPPGGATSCHSDTTRVRRTLASATLWCRAHLDRLRLLERHRGARSSKLSAGGEDGTVHSSCDHFTGNHKFVAKLVAK